MSLPQGEETARIAQWRAERSGLFSTRRMAHPLPKGEGWGKQTTARRSANFFDLSCDRRPRGHMALSHSRFHASGFAGGLWLRKRQTKFLSFVQTSGYAFTRTTILPVTCPLSWNR